MIVNLLFANLEMGGWNGGDEVSSIRGRNSQVGSLGGLVFFLFLVA